MRIDIYVVIIFKYTIFKHGIFITKNWHTPVGDKLRTSQFSF